VTDAYVLGGARRAFACYRNVLAVDEVHHLRENNV
jgi:hypothetical protein